MAIPPGLKRKPLAAKKLQNETAADAAATVPGVDSGDRVAGNLPDAAPAEASVSSEGANAKKRAAAAAAPSCGEERNPVESADAQSSSGDEKSVARAPSSTYVAPSTRSGDEDATRAPSTRKKEDGDDVARASSTKRKGEGLPDPSNRSDEEDEDAAKAPASPTAVGASSAAAILSGNKERTAAILSGNKERAATSLVAKVAVSFANTSYFLHRLLECCGLAPVIVGENLKTAHVSEKKTCVSQATMFYHIKEEAAENLSMCYSSFRVVLGDGECFYRSFIFSYLEHLLDRSDTNEEDCLLSEAEKITSAYENLNWRCEGFYEHCEAFKELLRKLKGWKSETGVVSSRRMRLLRIFRDYRESEHILCFLRIASVTYIFTHPELSAFYPTTGGISLEEYCRLEIIRKRSFADHLAIAGLTASLDIPLRVFSLGSGMNQDLYIRSCGEANTRPIVTLLYTGIHYDILYPC